MGPLANLKRQHSDVLWIANYLKLLLQTGMSDPEAFKIRHELSILSSKLTIHLAMEDKALYPYLLKSQNLTVEKTAKQFMDEMGNLVTTFKEYNHKWFHTNLIRAQFEEFRTETDLILQALKLRIKREENELYPLVEENL